MLRIVLATLAIGTLVGCETIEGAGEDLQSAGSAIESEANETQAEIQE